QNIPQQEKELLEISRRKASKSELFDFLLQKKEEAALSYAPTAADSRIVDEAVSSIDPVGPKSLIVYAISGLVACGMAIGFIFVKEVVSTKVLFRSEIEESTNVPVKGELLLVKQKTKAKDGRQNNRLISE